MIAPFSSPIFLVGYMGSGKTTVGKALASRHNLAFLDLDQLFEEKVECTISQFFTINGEAAFRDREAGILRETLSDGVVRVIAGGGGVVIKAENRQLIKQKTLCCFLDPPFQVLWDRLKGEAAHRPLLRGRSEEEARQHWESRRKQYLEVATLICDADLPITLLVEKLTAFLKDE